MHTVRQVLVCVFLVALTVLSVAATIFVRAATATVAAVPAEIRLTRAALVSEASATRQDLIRQIAVTRSAALVVSDRQATAFRTGLLAESALFGDTTSRQLGATLSRIDIALDSTASLEAVTNTSQDAQALADVLRFLTSMVQMNRNSSAATGRAASLADSATVTATGPVMRVTVMLPEQQLEQLLMPAQAAPKAKKVASAR